MLLICMKVCLYAGTHVFAITLTYMLRDIALNFSRAPRTRALGRATAEQVEGQVQVRDKRFGARRRNPFLGNISVST